jgi:thiamine-monophosphate kinase
MNELALIERIAKLAGKPRSGIVCGIGDDCAIYRPKPGEDLLFTTDQMIEGVHFRPEAKPARIGERALARSLSDIAAMGGSPRFCLVMLALPQERTGKWATSFYRGLLTLATKTQTTLAGGDVAHNDRIHVDVMVCGAVPRGKALRRDGARAGDKIYVSGPLGRPWETKINPRLALGQSLLGRATACMDLSDGLSIDLHRMCVASKLAARLESVPLYKGATIERALHGGEDYELLFTLPKILTAPPGCFLIGEMREGVVGQINLAGAKIRSQGYRHFQ